MSTGERVCASLSIGECSSSAAAGTMVEPPTVGVIPYEEDACRDAMIEVSNEISDSRYVSPTGAY